MTARVLYRIASIVFVLFAIGHTAGFLAFRPGSPDGLAVYEAMRSVSFDFNGVMRSYAAFYVGFGLQITAFLAFCAALAWQLGQLSRSNAGAIRPIAWAFVAMQLAILLLSVRYFFIVPTAMCIVIFACLLLAAWRLRADTP